MEHYIIIAEMSDISAETKLIDKYLEGHAEGNDWVDSQGTHWHIVITGVGAINVIRTLQNLDRQSVLLNIGFVGSANFTIGSLIQVSEVFLNHPNCRYQEPALPLQPLPNGIKLKEGAMTSVCYSGADFVLQSDYHDCIFDMELAYIASMGWKHLSALKVVSDNLSLHAYREVAAGVE